MATVAAATPLRTLWIDRLPHEHREAVAEFVDEWVAGSRVSSVTGIVRAIQEICKLAEVPVPSGSSVKEWLQKRRQN